MQGRNSGNVARDINGDSFSPREDVVSSQETPLHSRLIRRLNPSAVCPACDRFAGAALRCPYCDQKTRNSRSLLLMRASAILLSLLGLAFLYLAPRAQAPLIDLSNVSPMMNFARVRIKGTVSRKPYVDRERKAAVYVSFNVKGPGGRVRVKAYGQDAAELEQVLPAVGQAVQVEGSLRVSDGGKLDLIIRDPGELEILKAPE